MSKKIIMALCLVAFSQLANAGVYVGVYGGSGTSSFDGETVLGVDTSDLYDGLAVTGFGAEVGYLFGESFGLELNYTSFNFEEGELDLLGYEYTSELSANSMGIGIRYFFLTYLNLKVGTLSTSFTQTLKIDGATVTGSNAEVSENGSGLYYGLGGQIPLGMFAIFAEYVSYALASDLSVNMVNVGARFMF